jgi:hypothetical protein
VSAVGGAVGEIVPAGLNMTLDDKLSIYWTLGIQPDLWATSSSWWLWKLGNGADLAPGVVCWVTDRKLDAIDSNCNLDRWLPFCFTLHWPTTTLDVLAFAFHAHTDSKWKMALQNYRLIPLQETEVGWIWKSLCKLSERLEIEGWSSSMKSSSSK